MSQAPRFSEKNPLFDCLGNSIRTGEDYLKHLRVKFEEGIQTFKKTTEISRPRILNVHPSPKLTGYRCLTKFAVRKNSEKDSGYQIGLFAPGTHEITHATSCPTHTPALNRLLNDIYPLIEEFYIEPYCEKTHTGNLRYIVARITHRTDEIMLTLVMNEPNQIQVRALVQKLKMEGHNLKSVYINRNSNRDNVILTDDFIKISGSDYLRESLHNLLFEIGPKSFFQINPWQASDMYRRIADLAGEMNSSGYAWDLYSGVGQIAMFLCQQGYEVLAIEEIEQASEGAQRNARLNGFEERFTGLCGRVEDLKKTLVTAKSPNLITVNPSRRGLAENVTQMLADIISGRKNSQLIYVSCEMDTLARDAKILLNNGMKLRQIEAFDMFPHTNHLEWLAVFTS